MGFFDRLQDFGDREQVRTSIMKIDIGIQQIENATSLPDIKGLAYAVREEVGYMRMLASKLTSESLGCLDVKFRGRKIPYYSFLSELQDKSEEIVKRCGIPIF